MSTLRHTKKELYNWLVTGDTNTAATSITDYPGFASRAIDLAVQHNPTAVYTLLKASYGKEYPNYTAGMEYTYLAQQSMSTFLHRKVDALADDQKYAYVKKLLDLPTNPNIKNWTVPTDL